MVEKQHITLHSTARLVLGSNRLGHPFILSFYGIGERPQIRFRFSFYKEPIGTGSAASPPGVAHKARERLGEADREAAEF